MTINAKKIMLNAGFWVSLFMINAAFSEECAMALPSLEVRFEKILFSKQGDPVNSALEFLKKSEGCIQSKNDKALLADLYGEAFHLAYVYSGEQEFFEYSVKEFNSAAALNTERNEKIYWHMSRLMRSAGRYSEAIQYINKVLNMSPQPSNPLPYLETAFQLVVDTKQWDDAKGLMDELFRRDKRYYANPNLLLASVETLCHFDRLENAKIMIKSVDEQVSLDEVGVKILKHSKEKIKECEQKDMKIKT